MSCDQAHKILPKYEITLEVKEKNSNKVISVKKVKGKTWVYNFIEILFSLFLAPVASDVAYSVRDTSNTARDVPNIDPTLPAGYLGAPAGNADYGIVVGSGASPSYDPTKYALDAKIVESAMNPSECAVEYTAEHQIRVRRSFTNNSGGDLTVTEVGLICNWRGFFILLSYDVISGGITVPAGGTLTVTYTISLS